ncbi:MAG: hypothetical protein IIA54_00540 [Chloroflexi bacterium]|nr:hypothetical protein [Chloroflexota bacterium]
MSKPLRPRLRTNTERGRASRFAAKLAKGEKLRVKDRRWLERYDRAVVRAEKNRDTIRKSRPRLPAKVRPRTHSERARASELRTKQRSGKTLTKREARKLETHDSAVTRARQARAERAARKRKRSPGKDAADIAKRLAGWLGATGEAVVKKMGPRTGATVEFDENAPVVDEDDNPIYPTGPPDLFGTLSGTRAMTVRVELLQRNRTTRWTTILAYTDDTGLAAGDIWAALSEAVEAYDAIAVLSSSAIVGP